MTTQPEALRLADAIDPLTRRNLDNLTCAAAAAELRRLSAVEAQRDALLEALQFIAATDPVDAALDPQRAVRIARAAIAKAEGGQ